MPDSERDYIAVAASLSPDGTLQERMQAVVDALWRELSERGVSWVGFYLDRPGEPDDVRLVLGPHRDQPACSPLALHGVCGQALRFRMPRIVEDVRELGDDYVACDPRDLSEIVIPLIDRTGHCWGVLDLDSYELGAFDETDEAGLKLVLTAAGLLED
ncbi:MAG: GAF domain-containing protein [Phycisphaerales bacterium]|nr:MAG: GAF domain-containing protein [Phycisphaerales bacterium]